MDYSEIVNQIVDLYKSPDGGAGGYGHIVFDDDNIETPNIVWCIEQAEANKYSEWICEETRVKSITALYSMLALTERQRQKAINLAFVKMYPH